jgi:hypothetical protein
LSVQSRRASIKRKSSDLSASQLKALPPSTCTTALFNAFGD